jgi:hypothetical protein
MPNVTKEKFLADLRNRAGALTKLPHSNSLFEVSNGRVRIYVRYSKVHDGRTTFYGLRKEDLRQLEGHCGFIVFLWADQLEPVFIPFGAYEEIFRTSETATDGQYKAQIYLDSDTLELYLARVGRFNLEGMSGWNQLAQAIERQGAAPIPDLSHSQVQSILSAIGHTKGYDVWVPQNNQCKLDHDLIGDLVCRQELPLCFRAVREVLQEIDVLWLDKGSSRLSALFEVEHSTPIYSALLRFNDVHLFAADAHQTFRIIADESRRSVFVNQLGRPTFRTSGLDQVCTFLEYRNVYGWFTRVCKRSIPFQGLLPAQNSCA